MQSGTVSNIDAFLEINGKERITCQFKRHLSPMTVGLITRSLPMEGNAHKIGNSILYFETKINSGIERKRMDFNKGDILVTSMTTPDWEPIMKKSSGIITDKGGRTCHAAIVARELGVPCIVGTRIATKILKDGDIVELDANHGIVRIIKC